MNVHLVSNNSITYVYWRVEYLKQDQTEVRTQWCSHWKMQKYAANLQENTILKCHLSNIVMERWCPPVNSGHIFKTPFCINSFWTASGQRQKFLETSSRFLIKGKAATWWNIYVNYSRYTIISCYRETFRRMVSRTLLSN